MGFAMIGDLKAVRDALAPGSAPPCRKEGHRSQGAAESHLRALLKSGKAQSPERLNAYRCRKCGRWHIGRLRKDWP